MTSIRAFGATAAVALVIGLAAGFVAEADEIRPPLLQIGQTPEVVADGRVGEDEWSGATSLGLMVGPDGMPVASPADVQLGWNFDGLTILWTIDGAPEARRRERDAEVWRDDSVQVRLQSEEGGPALRFAVNAAGSIFDSRNGDSSWNPLWKSVTLRGAGHWRVEMLIPFAAIGIVGPSADTPLRADFIINRPGSADPVAGWATPSQSEAAAYGFLLLAPSGSPVMLADATIENNRVTVTPRIEPGAGLRVTLFGADGAEVAACDAVPDEPLAVALPAPGFYRLRLAGFSSAGELVLQREFALTRRPPLVVTATRRLLGGPRLALTIDGSGLEVDPEVYAIGFGGSELEVPPGPMRIGEATVDLSGCPQGEISVTVTARAEGRDLACETLRFTLPEPPDWASDHLGREGHVADPAEAVRADGERVRCGGAEYNFDDQPMPISIRVGGRELLSAPLRLKVAVDGAPQAWTETNLRWTETSDTQAVAALVAESASAEVRIRAACHPGGLITFELKTSPEAGQAITSATLEIHLSSRHASAMMVADGTPEGLLAMATPDGAWSSHAPAPAVWLGGDGRGLQWLGSSAARWPLHSPDAALRTTRSGEQTTLTVTLLDQALEAGTPFETAFALQTTQRRHGSGGQSDLRVAILSSLDGCDIAALSDLHAQGVRTVVLDDARFRPRPGGPGASADAEVVALAAAAHELGMRLLLVADHGLMTDPAWEAYRDEVLVVSGGEVRGEATSMNCAGSAWGDYAVAAVADAMERYDLDGVHLRGIATPPGCSIGIGLSGYSSERAGADWSIAAAREMMMRLRAVVDECKPEGLLTVECPGGAFSPATGLADLLMIPMVDASGAPLSPEQFISLGGDGAFGPAAAAILPSGADQCALSSALGLALAEDAALIPVVGSPGLAIAAHVWETYDNFEAAAADRVRSGGSDAPVRVAHADAVVTSWPRIGQILAVVHNSSDDSPVFEIEVAGKPFNLGPRLWAEDIISGQQIPLIGSAMRMRMAPRQTALILIRNR